MHTLSIGRTKATIRVVSHDFEDVDLIEFDVLPGSRCNFSALKKDMARKNLLNAHIQTGPKLVDLIYFKCRVKKIFEGKQKRLRVELERYAVWFAIDKSGNGVFQRANGYDLSVELEKRERDAARQNADKAANVSGC